MLFGEAIWDPVALVPRLGSPAVVVLALIALTIATLSTNIAANVVSPANGFSNLWPAKISFRTGGLITCAIGVLIMPWNLYQDLGAYIFTWLIGYGALLGPIAGIMICDYFLLRRTRLDRDRPLRRRTASTAASTGGRCWCWRLAVLPNLPGFINAVSARAIFPALFDEIYRYAWFIGVGLAVVLYYALMAGRAVPASNGGEA